MANPELESYIECHLSKLLGSLEDVSYVELMIVLRPNMNPECSGCLSGIHQLDVAEKAVLVSRDSRLAHENSKRVVSLHEFEALDVRQIPDCFGLEDHIAVLHGGQALAP